MMIGRDIDEQARPTINQGGDEILVVRGSAARIGSCNGVSLTVRAGELIGIAGLVGSGRTELLRAIFGADRVDGGEMTSPRQALRAALADRRGRRRALGSFPRIASSRGLFPGSRSAETCRCRTFELVSTLGIWLDRSRDATLATNMVTTLKIEPPVPRWR